MFRTVFAALSALSLVGCASDGAFGDLGNILGQTIGQSELGSAEIDAGLRQALEIGTGEVAGQLGARNGFFSDPEIRIPLPGRLADVQSNLSKVGLSGPLDNLEQSMNHAVEDAMPIAKDLVIDAVRGMSIEDALAILNGGDTAATDFLRRNTQDALLDAFRPRIYTALEQANVFQALESGASRAGLSGIVTDLQSEMVDKAASQGLDGVFFYLAQEEKEIRENPAARTTELLRKVFGDRG